MSLMVSSFLCVSVSPLNTAPQTRHMTPEGAWYVQNEIFLDTYPPRAWILLFTSFVTVANFLYLLGFLICKNRNYKLHRVVVKIKWDKTRDTFSIVAVHKPYQYYWINANK